MDFPAERDDHRDVGCQSIRFAVLVACFAGCVRPATQATVQLGTDVPPQEPLSISVWAAHGSADGGRGEPVHRWLRTDGAHDSGSLSLPASFGVTPSPSSPPEQAVTLIVEATSGRATLRRTVRFRFVSNIDLEIPIFLPLACAREDRSCGGTACSRVQFCESMGQTCGDDGDCVTVEHVSDRDAAVANAGAPVPCVANSDCSAGEACVAFQCQPCHCPCAVGGACMDDGTGACVAVSTVEGAACDDNDPCTYGDSCVAGNCRGSSITCATDECAARSCNGTATCTVVQHGRPVYQSVSSSDTYDYRYSGTGAPVFYTIGTDPIYELVNGIGDEMLSTLPNESNTCDWCSCSSACAFSNTGRTIQASSTQLPGMTMLYRWIGSPHSMFRHAAGVVSPGAVWARDVPLRYVCPP